MLSGKVDATLGAFWNYEGTDLQRRGRDPVIQRMEKLGVPTYDELVFVVRRRDLDQEFGAKVRRFMQATARGHDALKADPQAGLEGLLDADPGLDRGLQEAVVKATLPVFFPADAERPFGYQDPAEWQRYADWMLEAGLITRRQVAERVRDERVPGRRGARPRRGSRRTERQQVARGGDAQVLARQPLPRRRSGRRTRAPPARRRAPAGCRC